MTLEETIYALLADLVDDRVTPDVVAEGSPFPAITYQQIGGRASWYAEGAMPSHKHARLQINVWAKTRLEASEIARQVERRFCTTLKNTEPYGAPNSTYEELLDLYGTRQDFGVWYPDP